MLSAPRPRRVAHPADQRPPGADRFDQTERAVAYGLAHYVADGGRVDAP